MLIQNKIIITIFSYIVISITAISLISFAAKKYEPYLIVKFITKSAPNATKQETLNDLSTMDGEERSNKLNTLLTVIALVKLTINIFILYICSCFIARKLNKSVNNASSAPEALV